VSPLWENPEIGFFQGPALVEYNGGDGSARNVPDVAALADPLTGVGIYLKDQGGWLQNRWNERFCADVGRLHEYRERRRAGIPNR
jgi:hypothetical protein